jgi:endonuclease/exonuclease/phosphatase family metal-dependent hydrolase
MLIFQNVARLTVLTGWEQEAAFGWVLSSQILGLTPWSLRRSIPATAAIAVLLFCTLLQAWPTGAAAALLLTAGHVLSVLLLTTALLGTAAVGRSRLVYGPSAGMLLLVVLVFLYYSAYALPLPVSNAVLAPLAALFVGVAAANAARNRSKHNPLTSATVGSCVLVFCVLPLLVLPMLKAAGRTRAAVRSETLPLRMMTFNLHCGFDPQGHLGLEAIARVIEAEDPDIVGLQEVSRGWVICGSVDMLVWLSRRLGMSYRFAPAADPLWGNAVFSRLPIVGQELRELPPRDLLMRRGFTSVDLQTASDEPLEVIVTHYHHLRNDSDVRVTHSRALLDFWRGRPRTVLMGDFNAVPGDPEIELLRQAGLTDVIEAAGLTPGYTAPAGNPWKRIDYIFLPPDLTADDVVISPALVSDHFGVAATVDVK